MPTAKVIVTMDTSQFAAAERIIANGLKKVEGSIQHGLASSIAIATEALHLMVEVAKEVGLEILKTFREVVADAARLETLKLTFLPLLGSADAAEKRMKELEEFVLTAGFEMPTVAEASRQIELLSRGALDNMETLKMVGDVAAGAGIDYVSLARSVALTYDAMKNNLPVTRYMRSLFQTGAISAEARKQIELLMKAGQSDKAWDVIVRQLEKFKGSMANFNLTTAGLWEQIKNALEPTASSALGGPINEAIKPMLKDVADWIVGAQGMARKIGMAIAQGLQVAYDALKSGRLGELLWASLRLGLIKFANGFMELVGWMIEKFTQFGNFLDDLLDEVFSEEHIIGYMSGILAAFVQVFHILEKDLFDVFRGPVEYFGNAMQTVAHNSIAAWQRLKSALGLGGETQAAQDSANRAAALAKQNMLARPGDERAKKAFEKARSNAEAISKSGDTMTVDETAKENKGKDLYGFGERSAGLEDAIKLDQETMRNALGVSAETTEKMKSFFDQLSAGRFDETSAKKQFDDIFNSIAKTIRPPNFSQPGKLTPGEETGQRGFSPGAVSSLRKLGGGGGIEMTPFSRMLDVARDHLTEAKKHTELLEEIAGSDGGGLE